MPTTEDNSVATQIRQSNLFAAEDWKVVYEAFRKIDLQSYDYDTLREAMINHLRTTYPDNFNDWIGNQEFIFILDTLCFLGQNLAFRMDMNTRENFIDTAERRESILRLANMLAYSPRRNYSSRGLVKLTEITTSQDVRDSNGVSLEGKSIKWNDALNVDWYEQFIIVLNANMTQSNPFGDPVKRMVKDGLQTHIYRLSTIESSSIAEPFTATVNGQSMNFEIVNPDTNDDGAVIERHPNPQESRYILYRNDGNGFESPDTGFFLMFKQGTLKFDDYLFSKPLENRVQDIDVKNINELDVWCQQITADGIVNKKWTKVPSTQNIMYNSVSHQIKEIFSVVTRDNDQVSIRFPDSSSGTVPRGSFRVWYRVSNGQSYTVKTTDIQNKSITFRTRGATQSVYEESTLELKFSLQYQVQNSQAQETIEQIRVRAPQMYYTSNRLITGEDYNIGPMRQGNMVKKSKAINRTYSGHSRFIDVNDPTGKYQNTNVFADDGVIYRETDLAFKRASESLPSNKPESAIIAQKLQPLLSYSGLRQLYNEQTGYYDATNPLGYRIKSIVGKTPEWRSDMSKTPYGAVGRFEGLFVTGIPQQGMLLKAQNADSASEIKWTTVIQYDPYTSEVRLSNDISNNWIITEYYAPLRTAFNYDETNNIITAMYKKLPFGIKFNPISGSYDIELVQSMFDFTKPFNIKTNPCLLNVTYKGNSWAFVSRGVDYVFVGGEHVKFFFINTEKLSDLSSGIAQRDRINVLRSNHNPVNGLAYQDNINFNIDSTLHHENGAVDANRVYIKAMERDGYDIPLDPEIFKYVVPATSAENIELFWRVGEYNNEEFIKLPDTTFYIVDATYNEQDAKNQYRAKNAYYKTVTKSYNSGSVFYYKQADIFIQHDVNDITTTLDATKIIITASNTVVKRNAYLAEKKLSVVENYRVRFGRTNLIYQWKHFAPEDHRIDPAITNIHDIYVLTSKYYDQVSTWAQSTSNDKIPKPPTSNELQQDFTEVEKIKTSTDAVVWHSGDFVPLFGANSKDAHQCSFRVVRAPGSRYSDDEIRQRVIRLINEYFAIDNWDFGETFYFTELSTYIHQQLATDIASIVIVPKNPASKFGTLFQITNSPHELFVSTARVDDVEIVNALTSSNINIGR